MRAGVRVPRLGLGPRHLSAWTVESDQAGTRVGNSVATAGDVNGDGYSDVIVGAPYYDSGQTDEGGRSCTTAAAHAVLLRPQQRRADDSAPIQQLGRSESPTSFRLAALGAPLRQRASEARMGGEAARHAARRDGKPRSARRGSIAARRGGAQRAGDRPRDGARVSLARTAAIRSDDDALAQQSRWFAIPSNGLAGGGSEDGLASRSGTGAGRLERSPASCEHCVGGS